MASKQYEEQLKRLQSEQNKALKETKCQMDQWQTYKADYQALKERLVTLPDQLTHDVMVPFGKMAFMPGQLVHTNEILVLLGENWFAERSAKQAAEIVDRRLTTVDTHIEDLNKQLGLLQPRLDFTAELGNVNKGQDGVVDIREEYDEEKELAWKVDHRKKVQAYKRQLQDEDKRQDLQKQNMKTGNTAPSDRSDEELWRRLDQLEQLEAQRREVVKLGTSAESKLENLPFPEWEPNSQGHEGVSYTRSSDGSWVPLTNSSTKSGDTVSHSSKETKENTLSKAASKSGSNISNQTGAKQSTHSSVQTREMTSAGAVSKDGRDISEKTSRIYKDENTATESESESDVLDSDDDLYDDDDVEAGADGSAESEDEEGLSGGKGALITFAHTQTQQMTSAPLAGDFPQTPGELYSKFNKPKSILKASTEPGKRKVLKKIATPRVAFDTGSEDETVNTVPTRHIAHNLPPAFSGAVFERPVSKVPSDSGKPVVQTVPTSLKDAGRNPMVDLVKNDQSDMSTSKPVSRFKAQRQK